MVSGGERLLRELFPRPLDPESTKVCHGTTDLETPSETLIIERFLPTLEQERDRCVLLYGGHTRRQVVEGWVQQGHKRILSSGGWRNPGKMAFLPLRQADIGDVRFADLTVGHVRQHWGDPMRPPIEFRYPDMWQMLYEKERAAVEVGLAKDPTNVELLSRQKRVAVNLDELTIGTATKFGAPEYWITTGRDPATGLERQIGKTTSAPFDTSFEYAFVLAERGLRLPEGDFEIYYSNTTGARALSTMGANVFVTLISHGADAATDLYVRIARAQEEALAAKGQTPKWVPEEVPALAKDFVQSAAPVHAHLVNLLDENPTVSGIQFAFKVQAFYGLPASLGNYVPTVPHAFVRDEKYAWRKVDTRPSLTALAERISSPSPPPAS